MAAKKPETAEKTPKSFKLSKLYPKGYKAFRIQQLQKVRVGYTYDEYQRHECCNGETHQTLIIHVAWEVYISPDTCYDFITNDSEVISAEDSKPCDGKICKDFVKYAKGDPTRVLDAVGDIIITENNQGELFLINRLDGTEIQVSISQAPNTRAHIAIPRPMEFFVSTPDYSKVHVISPQQQQIEAEKKLNNTAFEDQKDELMVKFPGQFVVFSGGKVVANDPVMDEAVAQARKKGFLDPGKPQTLIVELLATDLQK